MEQIKTYYPIFGLTEPHVIAPVQSAPSGQSAHFHSVGDNDDALR